MKEFKKATDLPKNSGKKCINDDYNDHIKIRNYTIGRILGIVSLTQKKGEGSYALVRLGIFKTDGRKYAIKIYDKLKNFDTIKKTNLKVFFRKIKKKKV